MINSSIRNFKILGLLPFACAIAGCSTNDLNIFDANEPGKYEFALTQLMTSEANGKLGHGNANVTARGVAEAIVVNDVDDVNYTTNPDINRAATFLYGKLDVGLLSHLDVFYNDGIGAKIQLLGEPQGSAKNGYSMAVAYTNLEVDHKNETDDNTGSVKKGAADVQGWGNKYNLIFGKRVSEKTLWYAGAFYSDVKVTNVRLTQTNKTDFNFADNVNKGEGYAFGGNLGVQGQNDQKTVFNYFSTQWGFEVAYAHVNWEKTFGTREVEHEEVFGMGGHVGVGW